MGQIVRRKKKGRPAKADPVGRRVGEAEPPDRDLRRSLRRRNVKYVFDLDDYFDDDEIFEDNDEDQRRREKKLKLLLKLQNDKDGGSESTPPQTSGARLVRERNMEPKTVHSPPGTPADNLSGLPLPDKKTLELILDKLQKKDIYGVYAEPVDPEELPDYHDVIEYPMDFATMRNKLGKGAYETLEQFESDVVLICSNAMQYNAPDTIYHKQARTIQELAKKKFQKIRINSERPEKELKPEQNMRSSSIVKKQIKRTVSRTLQEPVGSDFSSGATLATGGDVHNVSNALQVGGSERPGSIDGLVEGSFSLNDTNLDKGDESLPGKGPLSRFGRKLAIHDENRRATYNISLAQPVASSESIFSTFEGDMKQLIPVGLYTDYSYARSLARFAATLGSVAWKVASKRIEQALPQGFKFGRGWVGEYEPLPTPVLILENCAVKEPNFFTKIEHATDPRKVEKTFTTSVSSMGNPVSGPFSENKLPLFGHAGDRPTALSTTNTSGPVKEQQVRGNSSEVKSSFFLSPGTKPIDSATLSYQSQNSQPGNFVEPKKKVLKRVELNSPPLANQTAADFIAQRQIAKSSEMEASRSVALASKNMNLLTSGSFKHPTISEIAVGGLPNGKVVNSLDSNITASSPSDMTKAASYYPHGQGQGISDPVQLMRMLADKAQDQQKSLNQSPANAPQDSSPALSSRYDSNAAVAAARVWMSVGAGGFRQAGESTNLHKNQMSADSLYNPPHGLQPQVSRFRPEFSAPGMHFQPEKNAPLHAFVPQGPQPVRVGSETQFQNQPMVFPQLVTADLSRFHLQSPWQNLSPHMHAKQKQESLPPDLNIGFQSPGSPGRHSSGVRVDSQQPDLALQL
ncbi:DNA-binding bromodomain-containing protein [Forsythia ovata]|uniref:DNA-binding bromodomain-containing protein n=1 Tax=Forsythia ovata TaxID=205694 RepID=A0ABD1QAY3_9LAMI